MARGKKTGGRDWKPGQSGNPNGRPKTGNALAELLRKRFDEVDSETGLSFGELAAQKMVARSLESDNAFRVATETAYGKPKQSMDLNANIPFPEVVGFYPEDYETRDEYKSTAEDTTADKQ